MKKNICSRKGVSLVEVVIALAIITLVSIATLTVIFMSVNVERKTVAAAEVGNMAENAVECFRFADGNEDVFVECLNKTIVTGEDQPGFTETADGSRIYVLEMKNYDVTVTLYETVETDPVTGLEIARKVTAFSFVARFSDETVIHSFTFPRGGTAG